MLSTPSLNRPAWARGSLLLALAAAVLLAGAGRAEAAATLNPVEPTLLRNMDYKPDPRNIGLKKDWQKPGEARGGWRSVSIPHVMDPKVTSSSKNGTRGWYRLRFRGPRGPRAYQAEFQQIRRKATVWLNGRRIAKHEDPYNPLTVPLRGIKPGRANQLIVRVDNYDTDTNEGWWNWGGVVRPAAVVPVGAVAARSLHVAGNLPCPTCAGEVVGHTLLQNTTNRTVVPQVRVQWRSPSGANRVETVTAPPLRRGQVRQVRFSFPEPEPQVWSPDSPTLYQASVSTTVGNVPQHVQRKRIGFRTVSVAGGRLNLNGRALQMRGFSLHEDVPGHGAAMTDQDVARIVRDVKAAGANVVRAHYAFDQRLLDRFDQEGILVYNEAPVYQADRRLRIPRFRRQAIDTVLGTVQQGYSHPSVIVNAVANELTLVPDAVPGTKAFLSQAAPAVRAADSTRPVGVDLRALPGYPFSTVYAAYDVLGFNLYFGWYKGRPGHELDPLERLEDFLDTQKQNYGEQAIIATELGPEMTDDVPEDPTLKGTHQFGIDWINRTYDIIDRKPYMSGVIYWTLHEFAIRPKWQGGSNIIQSDSIHNKGVREYFSNRPKPAYDVVRERHARAPLYRDQGDLAEQFLANRRAEELRQDEENRRRQQEQDDERRRRDARAGPGAGS